MPRLTDDEMARLVITDDLVYLLDENSVRIFRAEGFCHAEVVLIRRHLYLQMKYLDHSRVQVFLHRSYWETLSKWLESIGCNTCLAPEHLEALNTDNIAHAEPESDTVMIEWKDGTRDLFSSAIVSKFKIPVK